MNNENEIQAQKIYYEELINVIRDIRFPPGSPYVVLQDALLSTLKAHNANQAIKAAIWYIQTGKLNGFTSKENARFNMNNYKSVLTPEVAKNFMDYVEDLANQKMKEVSQRNICCKRFTWRNKGFK